MRRASTWTCVVAAGLLGCTASAGSAQQPGGQRAGAPPQTPPAQPGQRGGGRGRGAIQTMTLTTPAWRDGAEIPEKYAQSGGEASPPLAWTGAPSGTASFVLVVHDLDAPIANGQDDLLHWMVWNMPGSAANLPEGVPMGADRADGSRQISGTGPYYRGPAAPRTGPAHHYIFEIYALDAMIDVPAVGASPPQTRAAVFAAMAGHIRGKGTLVGLYRAER